MRITLGRKLITIISGFVLAAVVFTGTPAVGRAYQPTVGIVSAAAAKVRKEPSTSSDVVGSILKGSSVTVTDEVTDSAGTMWYKVTLENSTGYIRSDLLIKATVSTPNTQTVSLASNNSKPAATSVKQIAETKAYVNYKSVVVRQGASKEHEVMGSVTENTPVIITGEANANDGRKWYQIRYTNQSGREVVGFVRSDLLTIGDPPAAAAPAETQEPAPAEGEEAGGEENGEAPEGEEAPAEGDAEGEGEAPAEPEPAPEPETKPDYEMVYTQNDEGVEEWFLYDNINGTRQALSNLQAAAEAGASKGSDDSEQLSVQKIIIIVLAAAAAILAVIVVLLIFKIRDLNDDDYDDDDDDDDDDDEDDDDEDTDEGDDDGSDEEEESKPKKKRFRKRTMADNLEAVHSAGSAKIAQEKEKGNITIKNVEYIPEEEPFEPGKAVISKPPKRKAKNFLIDDDEFEFEFLNMDDRN